MAASSSASSSVSATAPATSAQAVIQDFVQAHSDKGGPGQASTTGSGASLNLALEEKRKVLRCCQQVLDDGDSANSSGDVQQALVAIKILSRDKENVNELVDRRTMDLLLRHAGIDPADKRAHLTDDVKAEITESQRCLNNLLLQSPSARSLCCRNGALRGLTDLLKDWRRAAVPVEMLQVDVKILFLITALCQSTRSAVLLELDGARRLLSVLRVLLSDAIDRAKESSPAEKVRLTDEECALGCEVLKALFNVTLDADRLLEVPVGADDDRKRAAAEAEEAIGDACVVMRDLFTVATESEEAGVNLRSNCVNLLTNVPPRLTRPLFDPPDPAVTPPSFERLDHGGVCVNVPASMLGALLKSAGELGDAPALREAASPVLSVLCGLARGNRDVRKYLRSEVLPPLRDMNTRPEEGDNARSRLCKLLTSPVESVATLVAEFLFILCKESVTRLVKYTGYGNAAGLLARRGLMLGGDGRMATGGRGDYSDDEEDSDTEEYVENAHRVNPIVGCVEPSRPSPFEGMTEEQKEHEAMKLVNLINDMHNLGVVSPAVPGPDGRPQQVDHVLQLQEAAEAARPRGNNEEEEDSA